MTLLIFGAQGYALGAYNALATLYPKRKISCFVVSAIGNNATTLGGLPVREIETVAGEMSVSEKQRTQIIIATPENVQPEIEETLELYGFHNYTRLTSERWSELMKLYHTRLGQFTPLSALPVGCDKPFIRMYMAKSHVDRPLRQPPVLPDYVFPIQVGRAKASHQIADLTDNTGDNISERNGNYSELTGLYWVWKNKLYGPIESVSSAAVFSSDALSVDDGHKMDSGDEKGHDGAAEGRRCREEGMAESDARQYYGFGQYRRMLELSDDDLIRLVDNDVDVVLPYPMPYEPNIHAHHERYIKESDWDALLTALEELSPEYRSCFDTILNQQYLYNYNVILAKKSVLRDYCSWLFPILMRTEELTDGANRSDRYIGYMAETLETLYFMKNSDRFGGKLNIVHTLCRLYV